jgi:hypothetical protein
MYAYQKKVDSLALKPKYISLPPKVRSSKLKRKVIPS